MIYRIAFLLFIISLIMFLRFSTPHEISDKNNITDNKQVTEIIKPVKEEKRSEINEEDRYSYVNNAIAKSFSFFDENNYNRSEMNYRKKLNQARVVLEGIVERPEFIKDAKSRYFLGKIYFLLNERVKARKVFMEALSLKDDQTFAWNRDHALYSQDFILRMDE